MNLLKRGVRKKNSLRTVERASYGGHAAFNSQAIEAIEAIEAVEAVVIGPAVECRRLQRFSVILNSFIINR